MIMNLAKEDAVWGRVQVIADTAGISRRNLSLYSAVLKGARMGDAPLVNWGGTLGALLKEEFPNLANGDEISRWNAPWKTQQAVRDYMARLAAAIDAEGFNLIYLGFGTGAKGRDEIMAFIPFEGRTETEMRDWGRRWADTVTIFSQNRDPKGFFKPRDCRYITLDDLEKSLTAHFQDQYGNMVQAVTAWRSRELNTVFCNLVLADEEVDVASLPEELRPLVNTAIMGEQLYTIIGRVLGQPVVRSFVSDADIVFVCMP